MTSKDNIINEFKNIFCNKNDCNLFDTKLFDFLVDKYSNLYMGEYNLIFLNLYKNTTQFKNYFADYFNYLDAANSIASLQMKDKSLNNNFTSGGN